MVRPFTLFTHLALLSTSDIQSRTLRQTYTLGQALRIDYLHKSHTLTCPVQWLSYRSSSSSSSTGPTGDLAKEQDPHETARTRLRPLIEHFEAPVDYAVAYGSGVIHQANRPGGEAPLTDLIISTPDAREFHRVNLRQNPSHYPLMARMVGSGGIAWLQENWGARVWYVTMVKIRNMEVKYGIISTQTLENDLQNWETLYISGRLQKPHLPLLTPSSLSESLEQNKKTALSLALILLGDRFTEYQLWEKIAGISYAGDPRMSIPGAENPEKVRNIVRGQGALEGFRAMYGDLLRGESGVIWAEEKSLEGEWKGSGDEVLVQPSDPTYLADLLLQLPPKLLHPIARHYRPTIVGSLVDPLVKEDRAKELKTKLSRREIPPAGDLEFWRKVAGQERIRAVVLNELRGIIRRPALTQSMKGLFTAGFTKSFWYSLAKFNKWLKGRKKKV